MPKDYLNELVFLTRNWFWLPEDISIGSILSKITYPWGYGVNFWKAKILEVELNERAEAATRDCSAALHFLQCIYFMLVTKNHQKFQSKCLVHEFSLTYFFNANNHGYRAAILNKNYLWLFPFFKAVTTYCHCEKVWRTMRTATVSP